MASMKRPASSGADRAAKKRTIAKEHNDQAKTIAAALARGVEGYPESVTEMLSNMCASSVGVYKEVRVANQQTVAEQIGTVLKASEVLKEKAVAVLKAQVDGVAEDKNARAQARSCAEAAKASLTEAEENAKRVLQERSEGSAAAHTAQKEVKQAQKQGDAAFNKVTAQKEQLEKCATTVQSETAVAKKDLKHLADVAQKYKFDASLISGMPIALSKAPATRGSFDLMVLSQVKDAFDAAISALTAELQAGEPGKNERAAAVAAADTAVKAAGEAEQAAEAALFEAKEALARGKQSLTAAVKKVDHYMKDVKAVMDSYDGSVGELKAFRAGALSNYSTLLTLETPPSPPPTPEPEEDVEEATEAAAEEVAPAAAAAVE